MLQFTLLFGGLIASAQAQEAFTFAVVGDTQGSGTYNTDVFPQIIADIKTHDPAIFVCVGDLIGGTSSLTYNRRFWEDWKTEAMALDSTEILAVPGNHDFYGGSGTAAAWQSVFDWLPTENSPVGEEGITYTYDYGNTRFISITSNGPSGAIAPNQTWLDETLADSGDFDNVIVFSHHPVSFSTESANMGGTSGAFWQSLVEYDVDAFFSGHWHRYQPSQLGAGGNTWETIIGTGGGSLFEPWRSYQQGRGFQLVHIDGDVITADFYGDDDDDGSYDDLLDSYVISFGEGVEAPTGLIARYQFDDGKGRTGIAPAVTSLPAAVIDDAPAPLGEEIHGKLVEGAVLVYDSTRGTVLELDGDEGGVEAGAINDYNLSINGDVTLSLFARTSRTPGDESWGDVLINYGTADYYSEDEETNYSYWLSVLASGRLVAFWEYGDGYNVTLTSSVAADIFDDDWHHLAVTRGDYSEPGRTGDSAVRFWVDGVELGSPQSFEKDPTSGGRGMLYLGRDVAGSSGYAFEGRIDDVCIFNEMLSESEIASLAAGGDCVFETKDTGTSDTSTPSETGSPEEETGEPSGEDSGATGPGPGPGSDGDKSSGGCGCAAAGGAFFWAWPLVALGLVSRRRGDLNPPSSQECQG